LKSLIIQLETSDNITELKQFFDINYSQIYYIFYESFINIEASLKQKITKLNRDELETVLFVFKVRFKLILVS
jgi:hypothetical protein